jgi:hypothetical protein
MAIMNNNVVIYTGLFLSAILLFTLFSSTGLVVPLVVFPCGAFAFFGVFVYAGYASLRGKNEDGKLELPKNLFVDAVMSLWMFCTAIAIVVGIPMLIYLSWIIQNHSW